MTSPWHPGELAVQERAGVRAVAERASGAIRRAIPPIAQEFLRDQPWLVLGGDDEQGRVWATALFGAPGFLALPDDRTVRVDAHPGAGDPLAGALAAGRPLGGLAIEPQSRRRMRLNGQIAATDPRGFTLALTEVFANCPKYISTRSIVAVDDTPPRAAGVRCGARLGAPDAALLERADRLFVATRSAHGVDVNHRGGDPGFVRVHDDHTLSFPDYRGNSMFTTFGNLELDPAAGLLVLDDTTGDLLHLTGRARVDFDPRRTAEFPGAERVVDFEVDALVRRPAASPLRWRVETLSRFNPREAPG